MVCKGASADIAVTDEHKPPDHGRVEGIDMRSFQADLNIGQGKPHQAAMGTEICCQYRVVALKSLFRIEFGPAWLLFGIRKVS